MYIIKKIWNPEMFQGRYRRKGYFEGWYFKLIDRQCRNILAVIPGIATGEGGLDEHAFIQVADAVTGRSGYFRFPREQFRYSGRKFEVELAGNTFSADALRLELKDDFSSLKGELSFINRETFPKSFLSPGIMGPFTFVPFMECYHGVVSLHHEIRGMLEVNGKPVDFTGGYGYIEKDWGSSFPEAWIWLQSNHFAPVDASVMFSLARIPWLGRSFIGLIAFVRLDGRFYRFATYNGARVDKLQYESGELEVLVRGRHSMLSIHTRSKGGNVLRAPKKGVMNIEIMESITSEVEIVLSGNDGEELFRGTGTNTGLEIAGELRLLMPGSKQRSR